MIVAHRTFWSVDGRRLGWGAGAAAMVCSDASSENVKTGTTDPNQPTVRGPDPKRPTSGEFS